MGLAAPRQLATGVPGLDEVLGGGLPVGRTCLVAGPPGAGKTTLANQLAFGHAAAGGRAVVVTLLAEAHDVMVANLRSFRFFDPVLAGERVTYLSLLNEIERSGLEGVGDALRRAMRESGATLLVVDGAVVSDGPGPATLDLRRFAQRLQTQAAFLGFTVVLTTVDDAAELRALGAHVDGVVVLTHERVDSRRVRKLEVSKLRGGWHLTGAHEFTISEAGVAVHPRLESLVGGERSAEDPGGGLRTGVPGLDAMLGGALMPLSSTLLLGTPGAGKTLVGLAFLAEGASQGERGLLVGFHESEADLVSTAAGIGLDLAPHLAAGRLRVLRDSPLEISVDAWAWRLLAVVSEHRPRRVFIDAVTDVARIIASPQRLPGFVTALTNELRMRGVTALIAAEIDAYADDQLSVPVPAASAVMDNGILLRQIELRSEIHRMVSILKARQTRTDPAIREFTIDEKGITVSRPFAATSGLLTGRAVPPEPAPLDAAP